MFIKYICLLQLFGLFAMCLTYSIHPIITPDIPANTNLTTGPFVRIGSGYYFIHTASKQNWYVSYEACRAMDADLITIETMEEWNLINGYLREVNKDYSYWTSGTNQGHAGTHKWFTSGKPINIKIWAATKPVNTNNNYSCDELGYKDTKGDGFNNRPCIDYNYYICETKKPVTASLCSGKN